jgi:hypothetical protein
MRVVFFCLVVACIAVSCKKSGETENPNLLRLADCKNYVNNTETVSLCFDSLLADSRCPNKMMCVWEGAAIAKFSFTKNNTTYPVKLSTHAFFPQFPTDTIIENYKIEFLNLYPYPGTHSLPVPFYKIKAEVKVTKQ